MFPGLNQTQKALLAQEQMLHANRIEAILGNGNNVSNRPHQVEHENNTKNNNGDSNNYNRFGSDLIPLNRGGAKQPGKPMGSIEDNHIMQDPRMVFFDPAGNQGHPTNHHTHGDSQQKMMMVQHAPHQRPLMTTPGGGGHLSVPPVHQNPQHSHQMGASPVGLPPDGEKAEHHEKVEL
jgi:hypothetical protein